MKINWTFLGGGGAKQKTIRGGSMDSFWNCIIETRDLLFCFAPLGNSNLFSYIASKNLAFKTPSPLGISNDLPWGGYGFLLELHISNHICLRKFILLFSVLYYYTNKK